MKNEYVPETGSDVVPLFIPRRDKTDTQRYICVNGEAILVQTGKQVYVQRKFAEVIENSMSAEEKALAYIAQIGKQ